MNVCILEGKSYDANVVEIEENFNILYTDNTKRTLANGHMFLDPIGTFIGHSVTFAPGNNRADFDALWDFFKVPRREGFNVMCIDGQNRTISYKAYTSNGARKTSCIRNGIVYWESLQVNVIPIDAQVVPT